MNTTTVKDNYTDAAVARAYDKERFRSFVGQTFDRLEKRMLRKMVAAVLRECPRPKVLDVPCGTGRITEMLLDQGLSVTGGDISPAMMEVAGEKCARFGDRIQFRQLDLERLDVPDNSYDLVSCIRLFHHLDTAAREKILRELARVSRRHVLVNMSLSTPYYRARRSLKRTLRQPISTTSSTWAEIAREAEAAGLRIERRRLVLPLVSENLVVLYRKA